MLTSLTIALHLLELAVLRAWLFVARVPVDVPAPLTGDQLRAVRRRIAELVPYQRVPAVLSWPYRAWVHLSGLGLALLDLTRMHRRKLAEDDEDFTPEVQSLLAEFPSYYQKNFHHQTDGYGSYASARRYDLQLELVFVGLGQRVRAVAASQLRRFLDADGSYVMLECGSGTGDLGAIVQSLFPEAELLATDPSLPYLRFAKEKYPWLSVRDTPTFIEDLEFLASDSIDVVCSAFMFHELPGEIRRKALAECSRVLREGGLLFVLDSSQDTDGSDTDWARDQFEHQFYEPYFAGYRAENVEKSCEEAGFRVVHAQPVLFSKVVIAQWSPQDSSSLDASVPD